MSNRVLGRNGARELNHNETEEVQGAQQGTGCFSTTSHFKNGAIDLDFGCDPA